MVEGLRQGLQILRLIRVEDRLKLVRGRRPREAADDLREALALPLPSPEQAVRILGEADGLERHHSVYTHRHR